MTNLLTRLFLTAVLTVVCGVSVCAQPAIGKVTDSNDLYYSIVNGSAQWVEVTYPGDLPRGMWDGYEKPAGHIFFPAAITYEGKRFSLHEIAAWTFMGCKGITGVELSEGLNSIGFSAFALCDGLTSVTVPQSVKFLGGCMFFGCRNLQEATLPPDVKELMEHTFADCYSLRKVVLPEKLQLIDRSAFDRSGIESITIPAGVTFIGENAFRECKNLRSIEVKAVRPPALGEDAFVGVSAETVVYVPQGCANAYREDPDWSNFQDIRER